ncbi:hypothetical protein [Wenzhou shrimp virus 3]|uniref:hypothetical protein n=1 Tax=Wenzhou shrimp virus 3 TaxID=1923650 RepID=UPI00090C31E6|nr:hypothetical protein [Wenzhou shrimp virus 3]APG77708.1 hypothetical protein [Wenzhou shrimp virus 3]
MAAKTRLIEVLRAQGVTPTYSCKLALTTRVGDEEVPFVNLPVFVCDLYFVVKTPFGDQIHEYSARATTKLAAQNICSALALEKVDDVTRERKPVYPFQVVNMQGIRYYTPAELLRFAVENSLTTYGF